MGTSSRSSSELGVTEIARIGDTCGPMDTTTDRDFEPFLADVRAAPRDGGRLELIARRPAVDQRELVDSAELDTTLGVIGDSWFERGSSRTPGRPRQSREPGHADQHAGPARHRAGHGPLAARGRPALRRLRLEHRGTATGQSSCDRLGAARGQRAASHWMCQVQRALRERRAALDQLARGPGSADARRERTGRAGWNGPGGRRCASRLIEEQFETRTSAAGHRGRAACDC